MKILHLNTDGWNEREGIARAMMAIASRLDHEAHLVAANPSGAPFRGLHSVAGSPIRSPWTDELRAVVERIRPDLVHLHGGEGAVFLAEGPAFRDVPVVIGVYGRAPLPRLDGRWRDVFDDAHNARVPLVRRALISAGGLAATRLALRTGRVAAVTTPDETVAARLTGAGPVFLARGAAATTELRASWSDDPVIVFAGRAEAGRGVDDLLAAFAAARLEVPRATLRLLLLPGRSTARWQDLQLPGVEVHVGPVDLEAELARAQVAAIPFRMNMTITPALVAAEAMSVGLPVIATDVACLTALVRHDRNGAVVAPRDPASLARALLEVLVDRTRWERLAEGARRTIVEEWDWDAAAERTDAAYAVALRRGRRPLGRRGRAPITFPATTPAPAVRDAAEPTPSAAAVPAPRPLPFATRDRVTDHLTTDQVVSTNQPAVDRLPADRLRSTLEIEP